MKRKGMIQTHRAVQGGLKKKLLDCHVCLLETLVVDEKTIRVTCGLCVAQTLWRKAS